MANVLSRRQLFATSCGNHVRASCGSLDKKASSFVGLSAPSSTRYKSLRCSCCEGLLGRKVVVGRDDMFSRSVKGGLQALPVQMTLTLPKANRWWEKGVQTNMKEISSAQDIVDSLRNAGEKLVIVDFFSPGCGGCRALHPKICQFAEANPEAIFLQVNYEEHKSMCYSLGVHVLPFFRFYRGAQGRLCSFSCTNATIKKFKDALAKHNTDRSSLGPAKGLEESELLALAANKDLNFNYTSKPEDGPAIDELAETIPASVPLAPKTTKNEKAYVTAWR